MNEFIEAYAKGPRLLQEKLDSLQPELFAFKPAPNAWSIQQIAAHLADTDLVLLHRMKLVLCEENPVLTKFDQDAWAVRSFYDQLDVNVSLQLLRTIRESFIPVLRKLDERDFDRTGIHTEAGKLSLREILAKASDHLDTHLRQMDRNIAAYGQ